MKLRLDEATFARAYPWHILLDRDLVVVSVGGVLARLVPGLAHANIGASFESVRPNDELSAAAFDAVLDHCWLLRSKTLPNLVLRGQFVPTEDDQYFFIGGPRAGLEVVRELGLTLADFAVHDAIGDCLFLVHAQQASLADAVRFSNELGALNGRLEELVRERTSALEVEKAERERMADELRLAHRLEAVGQLAAGVAHEINTPIQYVGHSIEFLHEAYTNLASLDPCLRKAKDLLRLHGDETSARAIEDAYTAFDADFFLERVPGAFARASEGLRQVANIVRAMKTFAHPGTSERALASVNDALRNTLAVASHEFRDVADLETSFDESLPEVPCFLSELNQVFLNLVVNAAHAIADTGARGKLRVGTRREGSAVVVEVTDNGVGIPEEIKERIFDPFFTTKAVGKGTGQGLTIVRSIVAKHRGRLEVRSKLGEGTTFRLTLPLDEESFACLN